MRKQKISELLCLICASEGINIKNDKAPFEFEFLFKEKTEQNMQTKF